MAAGLPAAVPLRDLARRLPQRAAPVAVLPAVATTTDTLVSSSLEQQDWEALHGAPDVGLVLDDLVVPLLFTVAAVVLVPVLVRLLLRFLPERPAFVTGSALLVLAAVVPGVLGLGVWIAPVWVLLVLGMTVLGWGHLLLWTTVRGVREIPESLTRSLLHLPLLLVAFLFFFFNSNLWQLAKAWDVNRALLVALVLWAVGGVVCTVTVSRHVREALADVDSRQPLRVRLNVRWNAASVHLAQASVFGVLVFCAFLLFGVVAVPQATVTEWTGGPAALVQLGPVAVSGALIKVSWVLGGFASLYMATTTSGDRERREQHLGPVMAEITGALSPSR